ncbi:hypothetical protein CFK38_08450 [Brachybacterium vulturis]|uniref:Glycosyltransferase n=1 Tax=Brachybacterium vulturis TaxID=2017484 RepID=A0A291GMV0_9MICO|nr:hypothetical protein [Brachybacterium vulturis]ATG51551.1 hypothetical protein CFK38_08450 [Brachybacterium vulturis]
MFEPDYPSVLHLSDPAFTATLLSRAAAESGRSWRVLPLATAPTVDSPGLRVGLKAVRGLRWEAHLLADRLRTSRLHVHSALARRHAGWAFGRRFALHLHGTDIRSRQYEERHRRMVQRTVHDAHVVFYSTPDLREHVAPLREDARLVPVPVPLPERGPAPVPAAVRAVAGSREYLFFPSRWEAVKGGEAQIAMARALGAACSGPSAPVLIGLDWGPLASEASATGVHLVPKMSHADFLATVAGARMCVGQLSGVLSASELDALAVDVPLLAPLNPEWYDGSHPSLSVPPVLGGVDLGMSSGPDGLVDLVREELTAPAQRATRGWVEEHHSPQAALAEVLAGYRDSGW